MVCGSFIHKHQKLETINKSLNKWMDKHTVVHPCNGILSNNRKKWAVKPQKRHRKALNAHCQVKEASVKRLHTMFPAMTVRKWQTMEPVQRSVVARASGRERRTGKAQWISRAVKLLCMIAWWWTCLSRLIKQTTQRVKLNVSCELPLLIRLQHLLITYSQCTITNASG